MSDGTILVIPIPADVIEAMQLPSAEKLEKALAEERVRDEARMEEMAKEIKRR